MMSSLTKAALAGFLSGGLVTSPILIGGIKEKDSRFLTISGSFSVISSLLSSLGFYFGGFWGSLIFNLIVIVLGVTFYVILYKNWPFG